MRSSEPFIHRRISALTFHRDLLVEILATLNIYHTYGPSLIHICWFHVFILTISPLPAAFVFRIITLAIRYKTTWRTRATISSLLKAITFNFVYLRLQFDWVSGFVTGIVYVYSNFAWFPLSRRSGAGCHSLQVPLRLDEHAYCGNRQTFCLENWVLESVALLLT